MRGSVIFSLGLHFFVLVVAWFGLPSLRAERPPIEKLMIVEMVDIAAITNAPPKPVQTAKPKALPPPSKQQAAPKPPALPKPVPANPEIQKSAEPPKPPPPPKAAAKAKVTPPKAVPPPSKPKKPPVKVEAPMPPLPKKQLKAETVKPAKSTPKPVSRPKPPAKPKPKKDVKKPPAKPTPKKVAEKPVAKPAPKKVAQKPPVEPKKAVKKPPKKKKPEETAFSKLLKSVTKMKPKPVVTDAPKLKTPVTEVANAPIRSSENRFDVNAKLSISELDAIRDQIADCWLVPAGAKNAEDLIVDIFVRMNPDGTVRAADIKDKARMRSDPFFRTAAESAIRALRNPQCSPLRLPLDKYEQWKTFTIGFNPRDLLG